MTRFKSILAATDFSADGNNAVRRAALLAHEHGAQLHILHVLKLSRLKPLRDWFAPTMDIDLKGAQARATLRRIAVEILGSYDVNATVEVEVGDPLTALMRASKGADLVVVGQRGHSRFSGLLAGRTADRLLRTCQLPILAVRTPVEHSYRRVLLPIDFTLSSDAAIQVAAQIRREASMLVFHAINSRSDFVLRGADLPEHIIREARLMEEERTNARMRRKVDGLGLDCIPLSFALVYGPAVRSTLRQAQQLRADLIVAGKQGRSTLLGFLYCSVSSSVLSEAACDVLIVPRPRDSAPSRAAATVAPRLNSAAHSDNAAIARSSAAHADVSTRGHWIYNTPRFVSRIERRS
ncbi:MAG TPA: universal stress protein [Aquabacterium sp.]|nr:universal stress protein [Aquabacterium sp.]HRH28006.1 universal stress protein [Aquabacterium sp.]